MIQSKWVGLDWVEQETCRKNERASQPDFRKNAHSLFSDNLAFEVWHAGTTHMIERTILFLNHIHSRFHESIESSWVYNRVKEFFRLKH